MEYLLNLSRELTQQLLDGKQEKLGKEFFFMFSISKFILLKEKILKKDSQEHVLYFNNIKSKKYIPVIYELYDYIQKNGVYHIKESDKVSLQKITNDSQKLAKALWILNKVRDSFAHGQYKFDFEQDLIIIDNDHMEEHEPYSLKCSIPLNLLNGLSFFINELENYNINKEYDNKLNVKMYDSKMYDSNKYNINKEYDNKLNVKMYDSNKYNINKEYDNKLNVKMYNSNKYNYYYDNNNYIYNNINKLIIKKYISALELDELKDLIPLLVNYKPKNSDEEKLIYGILLEYKLIIERKEELEKREEFNSKAQNLLKEMYHILGIKRKSNNADVIVSLYNYMTLSFSQEPEIDFQYLKTEGLMFEFDNNYSNTISTITNKCITFNEDIEFQIEQYNLHPNDQFRHDLMDKFAKFYTDILKKYADKNEMIIKSIRNSVEHGNYIAVEEGYVGLYDLPNQNDSSTTKFECIASPNTLFNITNSVNKKSLREEFTLENFFDELKKIVKDDTCDRLIDNLNSMSNIIFGRTLDMNNTMEKMYRSAIATIINKSIAKR